METKIIVHYWCDQSTSISGEPSMRDESDYPITVHQAKEWCKEHDYEYYVVEAAGEIQVERGNEKSHTVYDGESGRRHH